MSGPAGAAPQIEVRGVDKHYGAYHALKGIDLSIPRGRFVALVGPSGCGKSTLLRTIAGLERLTEGDIVIEGVSMRGVPPRKRDLAMVFQSYALYPHMTVRENLGYSLRLKRAPRATVAAQTGEAAALIGLSELMERYPRELSGGQRQRVAMGRAIVRHPKAFLFDEPLSNLDASLRVQMRKEVRSLHDRLGATSVYVTHDQIEAMTMADHVVVMREGRIEQEGGPIALYDHPASRFVAGFIGSPAMNFLNGVVAGDGRAVDVRIEGAGEDAVRLANAIPLDPGRPVTVGVRPEHFALVAPGEEAVALPARLVERTGAALYLYTASEPEILVLHNERAPIERGDVVRLSVEPGHVHLFDPETGTSLAPRP